MILNLYEFQHFQTIKNVRDAFSNDFKIYDLKMFNFFFVEYPFKLLDELGLQGLLICTTQLISLGG